MHIVIVSNTTIPVIKYGGIERMIWWLGKGLVSKGHKVTYLVNKGSSCNFANTFFINSKIKLGLQIPADADIVHYHSITDPDIDIPFITTEHGNSNDLNRIYHLNTVFVSENHAKRFGATAFVYNGIDFNDYEIPDINAERKYFHFLGDAAWKVKNVKGAISITKRAKEKLAVLGGTRLNVNMGFRFTPDTHVTFYGKVGGTRKNKLLNNSKGLIFPVLWPEPFGIAIIESLYYGCPVFGTPFGSLPELINSDVGFLSNSYSELVEGVKSAASFNKQICHDYALSNFSANLMVDKYLLYYESVLNKVNLNPQQPKLCNDSLLNYSIVD